MKTVKAIFGVAVICVFLLGVPACTNTVKNEAVPELKVALAFDNQAQADAPSAYYAFAGAEKSTWTYAADTQYPDTLRFTPSVGGKVMFTDSQINGGTVELDITLTEGTETGHAGLLINSSNYADGQNSVRGYYIGIGRNNTIAPRQLGCTEIDTMATFLQLAQMQGDYKPFGIARLSDGPVEYPVSYHLSISQAADNSIVVYVDGDERAKFDADPDFVSGSVGFRTNNAGGYIDNLAVYGLPAAAANTVATAQNVAALTQE
jgi:hypothetical protein